MAFIMHALAWLATNGTAAIVCFPGILYRGGAEQKIRQYLVDNNYVDCVIQLPSNLFFGTSIATCIFVMKKGKRDSDVLFIDASDDYVSVTKNNRLEPQHIAKIVEAFTKRDDVPHFAKRISYDTLKEADYNLSVSTYVTREDTREKIDITALNESIKAIVEKAASLRTALDALIATLA